MLLHVAKQSLLSRKKTALLTFLSLLISMLVLFCVEHIRLQAKSSFNRTISGTDLIVGAPSGQLNLLLYSVFRMGSPTNNIKYESYNTLTNSSLVKWAIPISLGDSHKGFRVLGTNDVYFQHYRYGDQRLLTFSSGQKFETLFDTVIGSDVAKKLGYKIGDEVVISHGIGHTSFKNHDKSPFVISGILAPTGTPVDKTVHVSLQAIDAIHMAPAQLQKLVNNPASYSAEPQSITAMMLGLNNKFSTFKLQRDINNYDKDRLMAVLPGVAMTELWGMMSYVENVLRVIAALVLISALFGLSTMLLASINERLSEIAVFRVLGAGPFKIMSLIFLEALLLTFVALLSALFLVSLGLATMKDWLATQFGLFLSPNIFSFEVFQLAGLVLLATIFTALVPSFEVYKSALHSQLSNKR